MIFGRGLGELVSELHSIAKLHVVALSAGSGA